jgi:tetratricopeptide (TPR) repeat protein
MKRIFIFIILLSANWMLKAQNTRDSITVAEENQLLEPDTTFIFSYIPHLPHLPIDSTITNKRTATTRFILKAKAYEKENKLDSAIMCYYSILYIDSSSFEYYRNIGYLWNEYAAMTADTTKYDYAIEAYTTYLLYHEKKLKGMFKKAKDIKESTEYQNTYNDMQIIMQNKKALTEQFAAQAHFDLWNRYEGMWVAYWFSGDRMQPQWVFSIEKDTVKNLLCAKLHPASKSFSEDIKKQIVYPDMLPDSTLYFRFIRKQSYRPLKSGYYVRHIFTEMSNPKYIAATRRRPPNVADPQQWLWEQDEKTERAHEMIRERIGNDYNKARQVDAIEEFFVKLIDPNIPHIIHVKCREIVGDPISDKKIDIDTLDIDCYKVPDSLTFILLGRWNKRIVNHEHSKENLKEIGFTKWNNLSITGEVFKHVGFVSLFGASIGLSVATMGATAPTAVTSLVYEIYSGAMQFLPDYLLSFTDEENLRNPIKWNNKMLNLLLQYYDSEEKLNLKSTAKTEKLKGREKRVFKKALKTNKQREEAIEIVDQH